VLALASHYDRTQKFQEGIELLSNAATKFKDNEKILFTLGVFEEKGGLEDKALPTMKRVLLMNPNNPHALNHIGYTYVDRNESLDEAEMYLKKAVQLAPDNGFIMDSLGWLFHKRGKFQKAAEVLEKANKVVKQVAEAEKYDLILQEAVYINPKHDITEKVIKAINTGK
jgi:tetratricopeptide (TPR) repeat protein